jgi:hypothetical protein
LKSAVVAVERVEPMIRLVRGHRVLLDRDLAVLYGVEVRVLVQAVKRNRIRFPEDFMFQLNRDEADSLRSQIVTLKAGRGKHRKFLPYVFTEQGVAMLSSVLRSARAVRVNIGIMRAFVRLRQLVSVNQQLAGKLKELEGRIENHDEKFEAIFDAIKELMTPPKETPLKIGFKAEKK